MHMRALTELKTLLADKTVNLGVTAEDLAAATDRSVSTVNRWISGKVLLPPDRAPFVADRLGIDRLFLARLCLEAQAELKAAQPQASLPSLRSLQSRVEHLEDTLRELGPLIEACQHHLKASIKV